MNIKVITTKGEIDHNPSVNWIGPDQELSDYKIIPGGIVPEMVLIHYNEIHYNLVISRDSVLAKHGTLSQQVNNEKQFDVNGEVKNKEEEDKAIINKLKIEDRMFRTGNQK